MTRRCLRRWTAWLLPLLAARLLVPAGFMVTLSGGELAIVLCSGSAPAPAEVHSGLHHHDLGLDQGASPDPAASHGASLCPFALASGGVLRPTVAAVPELPQPLIVLQRLRADPAWIAPAVLIDRIRGPPAA